jgi:hypothetical protein
MKQWLLARKEQIDHAFLNWGDEGVWIKNAGWVDVPKLLTHSKIFFQAQGLYADKTFQLSDAENFERVIFCEGFHGLQNQIWNKLPFLPAKGELIRFKSDHASEDFILNAVPYIYQKITSLFLQTLLFIR